MGHYALAAQAGRHSCGAPLCREASHDVVSYLSRLSATGVSGRPTAEPIQVIVSAAVSCGRSENAITRNGVSRFRPRSVTIKAVMGIP